MTQTFVKHSLYRRCMYFFKDVQCRLQFNSYSKYIALYKQICFIYVNYYYVLLQV